MVDRISMLPDEVLCHVLSFLPTEDAVATIVLSKRWRPLWPLVSTLDFDDDRYLDAKESKSFFSFIRFVYAAMLSRGLNQPIKNFRLRFECDKCPDSDTKVWLTTAIQCQLENLEILLPFSQVPCTILSCTTLVVLKLISVVFNAFSSVNLPSLKTLHLYNVEFVNPHCFMDLLYGCPALEDFVIHDIFLEESLEDLEIDDDISFVHDSFFEGKVKSLSKLVRAEVFFQDDLFFIPVKAFSNVEFLRIDQCYDADIPVFPNLIYLERHSITWSKALDMLSHCPKLQTAVFELTHDDEDDVWPDPGFVPECFSSHLRKCFLRRFSADECQMRFARYVMQNSTLLRTMTICSEYDTNHEKKLAMITKLASYPRSSAVCELLFM